MKIVPLLLISLVVCAAAYEEFFDSRGQCWRCHEGQPCERCPRFESNMPWPRGWSDMCYEPNCNTPENRRFLFPSRESDHYFRCLYNRNRWTYEKVECRCGTLFSMKSQECVAPRIWTPYCVELITPIMVKSCETGRRIVITGDEPDPRDTMQDPDYTTNQWNQDPDATTTAVGDTTTVGTGTDSTTAASSTTTANPCICQPMFPCWCNPCMSPWMMPCRSCTGCMGK